VDTVHVYSPAIPLIQAILFIDVVFLF